MQFVTSRGLCSLIAIGSLAGLSQQAQAQWSGKGEAGVVIANGNTNTRNANAKLELSDKIGDWKHTFGADGVFAAADSITTGQRWEAYEQSEYSFDPKDFWLGAGRYEDDRFSGFAYQATLSTGIGRHFIANDHTKLTATAGVGYKVFETRDAFDAAGLLVEPGDRGSQAVFRGTIDFAQTLTGTTTLTDKFLVESGSNSTFFQNDIAIQVKISNVLALAAGYSIRHNTDPPINFKKTDTLTTLNLVYEIKPPAGP